MPAGELLTDMERIGIRVDCEFLARMEKVAEGDVEGHSERFRAWVCIRIFMYLSRCSTQCYVFSLFNVLKE